MKNLIENIDVEIKNAMLGKEKVKLEVLRAIKKEFSDVKTAKTNNVLDEARVVGILNKMLKQRTDSATIFQEQGRQDLADNELNEIVVLNMYLPKQLDESELQVKVSEIISRLGVTDIKEMGKVMGVASKELGAMSNGKTISEMVRKLLQ